MKNGPHINVIGESGNGKSTFAATCIQSRNPRPVLVQLFDPRDKGTAYRERGDRIVLEEYPFGVRERVYAGDKHVATIEDWHEPEGKTSQGVTMKGGLTAPTNEYAKPGEKFRDYLERMDGFKTNESLDWYAHITDSGTFMRLACMSYLNGVMKVNDNQMLWGQATDELERFFMRTFPSLPITTIVIGHVTTEKTKGKGKDMYTEDVYEAALPGRLGKNIFSAYGENYRAFSRMENVGGVVKPQFYMQTETDGKWKCSSQLHIPSPFGPSPHWKTIYTAALKTRPEGVEE